MHPVQPGVRGSLESGAAWSQVQPGVKCSLESGAAWSQVQPGASSQVQPGASSQDRPGQEPVVRSGLAGCTQTGVPRQVYPGQVYPGRCIQASVPGQCVRSPCTRTIPPVPNPALPTLYTHLPALYTRPARLGYHWPPVGLHCRTGYHAGALASRTAHQAQCVKMEILTVDWPNDPVSERQEWPGTDVLTTFQKAEKGRLLIDNNTKRISSIWEQRDIFVSKT